MNHNIRIDYKANHRPTISYQANAENFFVTILSYPFGISTYLLLVFFVKNSITINFAAWVKSIQ